MYNIGLKGVIMNKCQMKGCENKASYSYITHNDGDKEMCQDCVDKYLTQCFAKSEVIIDLRVQPTKQERIADMMFILRQKVAVAKEAKIYGDDLFDYLISSAERLIAEIEEIINQ